MNNASDVIIKNLEKDGIYEFKNFFNQEELNYLRKFVNSAIKKYKKKNLWINDKNLFEELKIKNQIEKNVYEILKDLSSNLKLKKYDKQNIYKVLRIISESDIKKQSHIYHFDAHLFTILIPIYIPNQNNDKNGDLVIYPNVRKLNSSVFLNIIQKLFFQNFITRYFLKQKFIKNILEFKKIKLEPSSIYLFYGYRTLHGNLEFENTEIRATLLMHFYDVFYNSSLIKINRKIRTNFENKKNKL